MKGKNIQEIYEGWKSHRRWLHDQRLNSGTNARIFAQDLMEEIAEAQAKGEDIPACLRFMDESRLVQEVGFLTY